MLNKICLSARSVKVGDKRHALVVSDSEMFVFYSSSIFSDNLLICSEILETPTKRKKAKVAERPSPGSPEFKDLRPVTISYVSLPFFLLIDNFHDVVVIKPGR
jgi:hypothetical protein